MIVRLKEDILVISGETDVGKETLQTWLESHKDQVFQVRSVDDQTILFGAQGSYLEYISHPLNVRYDLGDATARVISNLGHTPFNLDDKDYASVEGFWQGLKTDDEKVRRELAEMHGKEAKRAGNQFSYPEQIVYNGREIIPGTYSHWICMYRVCECKFTQNQQAKDTLLSTGTRPLVHKVKRDSKTIPGVLMADIWMQIRESIQKKS